MGPDTDDFPLINDYAGFNSHNYNIRLRREPEIVDFESEKELNSELDRVEPYNNNVAYAHDMHTAIDFEILSIWYLKRIGCIVEFPNFLSSSNFRWPAFDRTVYQIKTNSTSKARYICPIVRKYSEQEVLFKSHSLFQVEKVDIESKTIYLNEISEADTKIVLNAGVFRLDKEVEALLKITEKDEDGIQPSLSDLGII